MVIYVSLDGVLCDFERYFQTKFGCSKQEYIDAYGKDVYWNTILTDNDFWTLSKKIITSHDWDRMTCLGDYVCIITEIGDVKNDYIKDSVSHHHSLWINQHISTTAYRLFIKRQHTCCKPGDLFVGKSQLCCNNWSNNDGIPVLFEGAYDVGFWEHIRQCLEISQYYTSGDCEKYDG